MAISNETHSPAASTAAAPGGPAGKDDRIARSWRVLKFSSVGIELAVATCIGLGIGYWLDLQFETSPWLSLAFLLVGIAAGLKGVFRAAQEAQEIMGDRPPRSAAARAETPEAGPESKGRNP